MTTQFAKTYQEALLEIKDEYIAAGNEWPATSKQIAIWALNNGRWQPPRSKLVVQCAEEIARAMREEYIVDLQGRKVRKNHVARRKRNDSEGNSQQLSFWADIRTAPREHMELAFQQRRNQILGECRQLKTDADSYNDNHPDQRPIQLVFDFTYDLAEMEQPAEYRPRLPR